MYTCIPITKPECYVKNVMKLPGLFLKRWPIYVKRTPNIFRAQALEAARTTVAFCLLLLHPSIHPLSSSCNNTTYLLCTKALCSVEQSQKTGKLYSTQEDDEQKKTKRNKQTLVDSIKKQAGWTLDLKEENKLCAGYNLSNSPCTGFLFCLW